MSPRGAHLQTCEQKKEEELTKSDSGNTREELRARLLQHVPNGRIDYVELEQVPHKLIWTALP